ncbi:DUF4336 domain-containing protein [Neorhizobium petrolearium]|uniref:DUF4336 domain-containing protein n=1 Tax=Neorhizobium petrolearium TaxID=515361 RepID=UPI003F18BCB6
MTEDVVTYPPLDKPKALAENVWIVDSGPLKAMGVIPLPVRMTILLLADKSLLLHSPTRYSVDLHKEIERLGPIRHFVAPNIAHWTFLEEWQRHVPRATTWAAPGLRQRTQVKKSDVRLDYDLSSQSPAAWADEIDQVAVPGAAGFCEICFYHRVSRTLILTDLVQNLEPPKLSGLFRAIARVAGVVAPAGKAPIYLRAIVRLKGHAAKEAARRLVAFDPAVVLFAHGRPFHRNAREQLEQSLSWLL